MALNINLYVHGVPMGQKTWGVLSEDDNFIGNFYGPKWPAKELMQVDIMECKGKVYSYYTFVKGQNVMGYDNRTGSYFALTIRMDAYYADLQNMYKILSAAYEKMCVGSLVQKQGEGIKFIVQDFAVMDAELKRIENHIISYIGEFSNNKDLISFSGFKTNSLLAVQTENLLECDNVKALNTVKATGKISVSPYYPSKEVKELISKNEDEMQKLRQMTSQQINEAREKASQQIRDIKSKAGEEIASVRRQASEEIASLKSQNSTVDKQMNELRQELQQKENKTKQLQGQITELGKSLEQYKNGSRPQASEDNKHQETKHSTVNKNKHKNNSEQKQQGKDSTKQQLEKVKAPSTSLEQDKKNTCTSHASNGDAPHQSQWYSISRMMQYATHFLPFLNTLIIVGVASFLIWKTPSNNSQELTKISANIAEIKDQISGKKAQVVETRKQDKENVTNKLSNAKIYITNANYLSLGAPSKVVAKDASGKPVRNGEWTTSDKEASVEDNHDGTALITATKSGTMEITYTVGSNKTTKTVTVK